MTDSTKEQMVDESIRRVSIVLCTYNGERFLREQLDSLLAQTYPIHEIIVQDDGSTDGTWTMLEDYAAKHAQMRLFRNQPNLGVNQNFLSAFRMATGEYIAISDQDDVWKPEKIETYMSEFSQGIFTMVYSDSHITNEKLEVQYTTNFNNFTLHDVVWMSVAPGHSMIFKSTILREIKNFEHIDFIYDWLINLVALASGNIKKTKQPLTFWRKHTSNVTDPTYMPPVIFYKKPIALIASVFRSLVSGESVKNFKWQFENIYLILENFSDYSSKKEIIRFLKLYKKETLVDLLGSSIVYANSLTQTTLKERVKSAYIPIYRYYFYRRDGAGLRGKD